MPLDDDPYPLGVFDVPPGDVLYPPKVFAIPLHDDLSLFSYERDK